jgi:hypothetical protein
VLQIFTFVRMQAPLCSSNACRRCDLETAECKKSFTMLINDASLNASRTPHVTRHTWHCTRSRDTHDTVPVPPTPQTPKCIYLRAAAWVAVHHHSGFETQRLPRAVQAGRRSGSRQPASRFSIRMTSTLLASVHNACSYCRRRLKRSTAHSTAAATAPPAATRRTNARERATSSAAALAWADAKPSALASAC